MAKSTSRKRRENVSTAPSRSRGWWIGGAVVLAALVALVVLAGGRSSSPRGASTGVGTAPASSPEADMVAPIRLASLDGPPVSLPAGRPGALFFSVSGCLSCIPAAQALATLKKKFGRRADAAFISLDPADSPGRLRARRDSIGDPPYPFAIDTTGSLVNRYQIQALGTTIIYDARGRIVDRLVEPGLSDLKAGFRKAGLS